MAIYGIDTSAASIAQSTTKQTDNSSLDKDAFLQLLVTQMQYQDPLEPTNNTEYMSQMAQFSSLEAMQNLNSTVTNTQALGLTGQYVIINTKDSAGNATQIAGLVDFVTISNGEAFLSVNDQYYSINDLDSVVDADYLVYQLQQEGYVSSTEEETSQDDSGDVTA